MGNARQARRSNVPQRSGQSLYKQAVPAVTVALPNQAEYEPTWKLLGQQPDGTLLPESEKRVGASDRLYKL